MLAVDREHPRAAAGLLRVPSATAAGGSPARVSAPQHTAILSAAHAQGGTVNPLLLPRPARTPAGAQAAVEETGDGGSSTVSHMTHEGGDGSGETLSLQLRRFASPVDGQFQEKVHFFQALEQGATDRRGASVESTDMAVTEQLGGGTAVELQGEKRCAAFATGMLSIYIYSSHGESLYCF